MPVRNLQRSFAGGEVSPEMFGRIDDARYQAGLATCRNFIVKPHGPVENRPGFAFVRKTKDSSKRVKLLPFTYSTTQTMVIELGDGYCRFHTDGGTLLVGSPAAYSGATAYVVGDLCTSAGVAYYCVAATTGNPPPNASFWYAMPATGEYEIPNPYDEDDLYDVHYVQSADVLTLVHPNYAPRELRRLGATNWQLGIISFAPQTAPPANVSATAQGFTTAKYSYQYVVTAVGADGVEESVASTRATGTAATISGVTQANPGVVTTSAAHNRAVGDPVTIAGIVGMTQLNGNTYTVNTVPTSTTLTLKDASGNVVDTSAFGAYVSGGTLTPLCVRGNLFETGCTTTIAWSAVAGATRYNVYKLQGGLYGYIGQTTGLSIVDDNIAPDLGKTPPTYDAVFQSAGNYPGAVSYFEQRRCFAGTTNQPQNIWMTKSGTESAMSYSLPIKDDDRIAFRVAAREANTIRHIVPLGQLLLMTSSAEWRVSSINSDAITPSTISVSPQSYVGAANAQPVIINNTLIYGAARGGHVRELAYNWQANGYVSGDLSLRAIHLFDGMDVVDMAYAKAPQPIVWFVSSGGSLLGLTYVPEQQVGGWHWHDTDGQFESCAVVAEDNEDVLYVVVRRIIGGAYVRYVERLASRQFTHQSDAFFVDCGATYSGAPADTISGLGHLEGKEVAILADGAVHPRRTVSSGAIHLDVEASKVHVGLPITADLETLPMAMMLRDGSFGQGHAKNVNKVWLRVHRSSGIFVGPDADRLTEVKQRTTEPYGSPPALKSNELQLTITPSWSDSGAVFVRQADPLPLTIVGMTLEVALGG